MRIVKCKIFIYWWYKLRNYVADCTGKYTWSFQRGRKVSTCTSIWKWRHSQVQWPADVSQMHVFLFNLIASSIWRKHPLNMTVVCSLLQLWWRSISHAWPHTDTNNRRRVTVLRARAQLRMHVQHLRNTAAQRRQMVHSCMCANIAGIKRYT